MLSRVGAYRGTGFYEHATLGNDDNNFGGISIEQGHPTRNFDEISVRESLLFLRLSDNALTKSD